MARLIDADALDKMLAGAQAECKRNGGNFRVGVLSNVRENIANVPTIDAIPVEWLRQKAEENSHYAEPYFAFAYVLHEWQQTKSIEELQAESEMRDWKAEQEDGI